MRSLSAGQWDRYFELFELLDNLPADQCRYAMLNQYAQGEAPEIISLVKLRLGLAPDADRCRSGERIGNFVLGEQIGRGGMGVIYRALQKLPCSIERPVAVKLIHPELIAHAPDEARQRFKDEMGMLLKLEHKGIARIYDGGIHTDSMGREQTLFFAMELVTGKPINEYVAEHRSTLHIQGILHLFRQVCDALHYAHKRGVIHRDIKPSNILVDANAEPRIIDFGLARDEGTSIAKIAIKSQSGTPGYMSPEQRRSGLGPITPASDVYALGVILYELLTGHPPWNAPKNARLEARGRERFDRLGERLMRSCPGCSIELVRAVVKATAFKPADRFASVADLRHPIVRCIDAAQVQQRRSEVCRRLLMKKVEEFWIDGALRSSLHSRACMDLDLMLHPDAIERPWDLVLQTPRQRPTTLPVGTKIGDVFRGVSEALLILGAPGAGKTTLLLELAHELMIRAKQDDAQPIPVVFHLSTWAEQQLRLFEWLIVELEQRYEIPPRVARNFLEQDPLVLLLDGLDEVAPICRDQCVTAINGFRKLYPWVALVVCSRAADYAALSLRLRLGGAVMIQPLTRQRIADHLERAGASLERVRVALKSDERLWELLKTPLMLSITVMVYQQCPSAILQGADTLEERRTQLLAAYAETVFTRRGKGTRYTRDEMMRWLAWLASAMLMRHQSVFYVEWMQPDWLRSPRQQRAVSVGSVVLSGLLVGIIVALNNGLSGALALSDLQGLAWGLTGGLAFGMLGYGNKINPVTRLRWSWLAMSDGLARKLSLALMCPLIISVGLTFMLDEKFGIAIGLASAVAFGYFGGLDLDLRMTDLNNVAVPTSAMHRSLRNARNSGIAGAFIGSIMGGWAGGWSGAWLGMSLLGVILALLFGGFPIIQHLILRWQLWRNGSIPWYLAPFLEDAVDRILLHRVGGGYAFIHRALLEYFAGKDLSAVESRTKSC